MIEVRDNIIGPTYQNAIANLVMDQSFEWLFNESTIAFVETNKKFNNDSFQFVSPMIRKEDSFESHYADFIAPLIFAIQDSFNFKFKEVHRIKFNMNVNNTKINIHPPHVDSWEEGYVSVIYYVHDCDGDTLIYDKVLNYSHRQQYIGGKFLSSNLNVMKSITPKKGTAVMFDSNRLHSASNPIVADRRVLLNCVFKV